MCAALESRADAAATYRANFGDHVFHDLNDITSIDFDVAVGGLASTQTDKKHAISAEAWESWTWAVCDKRPAAFAFALQDATALSCLEYTMFSNRVLRAGFNFDVRILNSADFGVPLARHYFFLVGSRLYDIEPFVRTHLPPTEVGAPRVWRTVRAGAQSRPPREGRDLHALPSVKKFTVPERYLGCDTQSTTSLDGYHRDTSPIDGLRLDYSERVPVTLRDVARCLTIPDDYIFPVDQSSESITEQLAIVVPPLLAECVAEALVRSLEFADDSITRAA
jgi:site-specific DNA-cytosine methylase